MSTLVRLDAVSGYRWVDFYVDQGARWTETITWWPGVEGVGSPVSLNGYTARLVVIRSGYDTVPVLDLTSGGGGITIQGSAGTVHWDVHADLMALLVHPVYQHELTLFPDADDDLAVRFLKGRVLVRASAFLETAPPPVIGTGYGSGPYGHGPYGGNP